jgi:hypothetical protein
MRRAVAWKEEREIESSQCLSGERIPHGNGLQRYEGFT